MFTLSWSRTPNDAKQAIVNRCKGFETKHRLQGNTKGYFSPPLVALNSVKPRECEQRWCFFIPAQAPRRKHLNTSLYTTKLSSGQVQNDQVYCKISTGTTVQHFYEPRPDLLARRVKVPSCKHFHMQFAQVLSHLYATNTRVSATLCPSHALCFKRLHGWAQLVLLWFKTCDSADSWKQTQYIE